MRTRARHGPEFKIQQRLIEYLETRGWLVERVIGNAYQHGLPDLFAFHPKWGVRWIDVKNPGRYSFTRAEDQSGPVGKSSDWESGFSPGRTKRTTTGSSRLPIGGPIGASRGPRPTWIDFSEKSGEAATFPQPLVLPPNGLCDRARCFRSGGNGAHRARRERGCISRIAGAGGRRGFHVQECIDVAIALGVSVTPIEAFPRHSPTVGMDPIAIRFPEGNEARFRRTIETTRGRFPVASAQLGCSSPIPIPSTTRSPCRTGRAPRSV